MKVDRVGWCCFVEVYYFEVGVKCFGNLCLLGVYEGGGCGVILVRGFGVGEVVVWWWW